MTKRIMNKAFSLLIRVTGILFVVLVLHFTGFQVSAQQPEIDAGVAWLTASQNASGSWGDPALTEFCDTTVVTDVLKKLEETDTGYSFAISFIDSALPNNTDYLARKTYAIA